MKIGDYFIRESVPQRIANAKGKFSTQFMRGDMMNEKTSGKKTIEESVRMEGYEVNVRKPTAKRTDMQQPITGHSEFWLG
jgi:hypothetical protein